jgi:hypothetical protein
MCNPSVDVVLLQPAIHRTPARTANKELLDIYTDYLISSFGLTTGTGLSHLLDGAISHDRIQRFWASPMKAVQSFDEW